MGADERNLNTKRSRFLVRISAISMILPVFGTITIVLSGVHFFGLHYEDIRDQSFVVLNLAAVCLVILGFGWSFLKHRTRRGLLSAIVPLSLLAVNHLIVIACPSGRHSHVTSEDTVYFVKERRLQHLLEPGHHSMGLLERGWFWKRPSLAAESHWVRIQDDNYAALISYKLSNREMSDEEAFKNRHGYSHSWTAALEQLFKDLHPNTEPEDLILALKNEFERRYPLVEIEISSIPVLDWTTGEHTILQG